MTRKTDKKFVDSYREKPCVVCFTTYQTVAHHITSRGAGGGDTKDNLMPVCFTHHRMIHDKGNAFMIKTFKQYEQFLIDLGRQDVIDRALR